MNHKLENTQTSSCWNDIIWQETLASRVQICVMFIINSQLPCKMDENIMEQLITG